MADPRESLNLRFLVEDGTPYICIPDLLAWVADAHEHAKASTFPGSSIGQLAELRVKLARMAELVEARVEHG